jgi:hypothetical protein
VVRWPHHIPLPLSGPPCPPETRVVKGKIVFACRLLTVLLMIMLHIEFSCTRGNGGRRDGVCVLFCTWGVCFLCIKEGVSTPKETETINLPWTGGTGLTHLCLVFLSAELPLFVNFTGAVLWCHWIRRKHILWYKVVIELGRGWGVEWQDGGYLHLPGYINGWNSLFKQIKTLAIKNSVFWNVELCSEACSFNISSTLKMEAVCSCETSADPLIHQKYSS